MSRNRLFANGRHLSLPVPVGTKSGDPVAVGQIGGVALEDRDSTGETTVDRRGVYALTVKAVNGAGNSAIAAGDKLFFVEADTPKLSKKDTGVFFGYALKAVAAGATATIPVALGA